VLTANLPIFSAGLIEADVRTAWSRLRQAALYESLVRRQALNDVRVAYENLATADRRLREYEEQAATSREALEQARNALANNLAINLDVLVAQDQLLNSELLLTGAQFDRTVFYLDLVRATGRLTDLSALPPPSSAAAATQPATRPATATAHNRSDPPNGDGPLRRTDERAVVRPQASRSRKPDV
jgi:outer membrane protein TolC